MRCSMCDGWRSCFYCQVHRPTWRHSSCQQLMQQQHSIRSSNSSSSRPLLCHQATTTSPPTTATKSSRYADRHMHMPGWPKHCAPTFVRRQFYLSSTLAKNRQICSILFAENREKNVITFIPTDATYWRVQSAVSVLVAMGKTRVVFTIITSLRTASPWIWEPVVWCPSVDAVARATTRMSRAATACDHSSQSGASKLSHAAVHRPRH